MWLSEYSRGLPASDWNPASTWARTRSCSSSGMPSSIPNTRIGTYCAKSATKSNESRSANSSRRAAQNSRTCGSIASIALGVNTRENNWRWIVWRGPSSMIRVPGGMSIPDFTISRMVPRLVTRSSRLSIACSTSAKRVTA